MEITNKSQAISIDAYVKQVQAQAFRQHGLNHILRDIAPDEFLPELRDRVVPAAEEPQGTAQGLSV